MTLGVYTNADTVQKMKARATNIVFMLFNPATAPLKYCQPFLYALSSFPKIARGMFRVIPPNVKKKHSTQTY